MTGLNWAQYIQVINKQGLLDFGMGSKYVTFPLGAVKFISDKSPKLFFLLKNDLVTWYIPTATDWYFSEYTYYFVSICWTPQKPDLKKKRQETKVKDI